MYTSKSGKKFGSSFAGRKKDEMDASAPKAGEADVSVGKPKAASVSKEQSRTNPQGEAKFSKANAHAPDNNTEGMHMAEGPEAPAQVVAQHGPAVSTHVHSDHKANKHHVVSHHTTGHMHTSDHENAQEAHNTASQLGGVDKSTEQTQSMNTEPQSDGFSMPSLG